MVKIRVCTHVDLYAIKLKKTNLNIFICNQKTFPYIFRKHKLESHFLRKHGHLKKWLLKGRAFFNYIIVIFHEK